MPARMALVFTFVALPCAGCGTFCAQMAYCSDNERYTIVPQPASMIYGGPITDVFLIGVAADELGGGQFEGDGGSSLESASWLVFFVVDFQLSVALDTALLPLTIAEQIELALRDRQESPEDESFEWED